MSEENEISKPEEELPLYEKLLIKQQEDLDKDFNLKKLVAQVRQIVATENKIDRLRKQMREEGITESKENKEIK